MADGRGAVQTAGYNGVNIEKFPNSFKDGLALCALIHSCRPQLIDFDSAQAGDKCVVPLCTDRFAPTSLFGDHVFVV